MKNFIDHKTIDEICGGHINTKWVREQTAFMAIGLAGMSRHEPMSHDWIAHNALFCAAYNKLIDLVGHADAYTIKSAAKRALGVTA